VLAQIAPVVIAISGLLGAIGALVKILTEVRGMRAEQDRQSAAQARQAAALDEHGRILALTAFEPAIADVRDDLRRHDKEIGRVSDSIVGLGEQVGRVGERLALADAEDRRRADEAHAAIHDRIDQLAKEHR
jgi:hypothetical protein